MTRPGRVAALRQAATLAVLLAVLVVGVLVVVDQREALGAALTSIGLGPALVSTALTACGVLATGECWRVWLASLTAAPPWHVAHRFFYLTQAGKYVPGAVWPFAAQVALAGRYGVARTAVLAATALFLLTHVGTGVVVGALGLGTLDDLGGVTARQGVLYALGAAALLCLLPPVLGRVLALLGRVRPWLAVPTPSWSTTARAGLLMLLAWACYGSGLLVLAVPLGAGADDTRLLLGTYAVAWVAGFAAVAAPAGIGAREAVVTLLLGPLLGTAGALAVAVVSRVALTVADLGLAAVSAPVLHAGRPAVDPPAVDPPAVDPPAVDPPAVDPPAVDQTVRER